MNSPIKYYGGKGGMSKEILKHFPDTIGYKVYVEAYGGGASLLFKKEISPIEIYNDIEEDVYSLFKTLSNEESFLRFKALADLCYLSRQLREEYLEDLKKDSLTIVERAFRYWYVNRTSYCGSGGFVINSSVRRTMSKSTSDMLSTVENLENIHQRLSRVAIENINGLKLIKKYDKEEVFAYLDPPYHPETRTPAKYKCDMTAEEHRELVNFLLETKTRILLSGYDNEDYQRLENDGWTKIDFIVNTVTSKRVPKQKTEFLWKNY